MVGGGASALFVCAGGAADGAYREAVSASMLCRVAAVARICEAARAVAQQRRKMDLAFSRWRMMPRFWYICDSTWFLSSPDNMDLVLASS